MIFLQEQANMFLILSAVLNLGNVEFVADDNGESSIDNSSENAVTVVAVSRFLWFAVLKCNSNTSVLSMSIMQRASNLQTVT